MNNDLPDRMALSKFLDEVHKAPLMPVNDYDGMPYLETSLDVIKYYNKTPNQFKAFQEVGYFIFYNVKVYESGTRDALVEKMKKKDEALRLGVRVEDVK